MNHLMLLAVARTAECFLAEAAAVALHAAVCLFFVSLAGMSRREAFETVAAAEHLLAQVADTHVDAELLQGRGLLTAKLADVRRLAVVRLNFFDVFVKLGRYGVHGDFLVHADRPPVKAILVRVKRCLMLEGQLADVTSEAFAFAVQIFMGNPSLMADEGFVTLLASIYLFFLMNCRLVVTKISFGFESLPAVFLQTGKPVKLSIFGFPIWLWFVAILLMSNQDLSVRKQLTTFPTFEFLANSWLSGSVP